MSKIGDIAKRRAAMTAATGIGAVLIPGVGAYAGNIVGFAMSGNPLYLFGIGWADEAKDAADIATTVFDPGVSDVASAATDVIDSPAIPPTDPWVTSDPVPEMASYTGGHNGGVQADLDGQGNPNDRDIFGRRPTDIQGGPLNGTIYGPARDPYGNPI